MLAVTVATGAATIVVLYAAAFLLGVAETVYDNAARALLPRVVRRDQLERGNSLLSTAESVTNLFLGAPIGALLIATWAILPLAASVVLFVGAAALIMTVGGDFAPARTERSSLGADIREGLAWLVRHRILRQLLWATALGALASPLLTRALGRTASMGVTGTVCGLAVLAIGVWPTTAVAFVAWPLSSLAVSAFNVQVMSVRQVLIPDALFGRVQGAYRTLLWGSIPIGTAGGGLVATWSDLPTAILLGGALATVSGVATWAVLARFQQPIAEAFREEPA